MIGNVQNQPLSIKNMLQQEVNKVEDLCLFNINPLLRPTRSLTTGNASLALPILL